MDEDAKGNRPRTFHAYRANLLESAVRLESHLDGALAATYALNQSTAAALQAEILWRMPITQRVEILGRTIHDRGLAGRYGFVAPFLTKYFRLRHTFAHSIGDSFTDGDKHIRLYSIKQGKERVDSFPLDYLLWMDSQSAIVRAELLCLYFALAPQTAEWHEETEVDDTHEAGNDQR